MNSLKRIFFDAYGGFADKRIKNLDKSSTFIVDDRCDSDIASNGNLFSYFCMIFADVQSNTKIIVTLLGEVPVGSDIKRWLKKNCCKIESQRYQSRLSIDIEQGNQSILSELAEAIDSIVAPGKARYNVRSYKYVCPRTAKSLRRLKEVLDDAWAQEFPSSRKGFFYL